MRAVALFALSGCTQIFGLTDPVLQTSVDASTIDTFVPPVDVAGDTQPGSCSAMQMGLVACFDFEGEIVDRSASGHVVTTVTNVSYSTGGPDGQYASVGPTSAITLAASTAFNTNAFTVVAWVYVEALPSGGGRAGVFDSDGRYGMFIDSAGSILVRGVASSAGSVGVGSWTHLAVTDDGALINFYVNGAAMTAAPTTAVPTSNLTSEIGGNAPTGDRLTGRIDKLRVFRRILSPSEVATEAAP